MPLGETWVSPCRTRMSSNGTPSWSATIWLHAVSWPCPCALDPVTTSTLPAGSILIAAAGAVAQRAEHAGRGQAAHLGEGRDADAQLDRVITGPPQLLLLAESV